MIVEVSAPPLAYVPPEAWGGFSYLLRLISDEIADKFFKVSDFWNVDLVATPDLDGSDEGMMFNHKSGEFVSIHRRGNVLWLIAPSKRVSNDSNYVMWQYEMTLEVILMRPPRLTATT